MQLQQTSVYDAVLFDFDGVLADSEPIHFACWTEILSPLGIRLTWEDYCANCIGITDRAMLEVLRHRASPPVEIDRLWAEYGNKKRLFRAKSLEWSPVLPETRELVRELSDLPLAVVSSSGRAELQPVLADAGILPLFKTLVCFEDVERLKPDPQPYLEAARRLQIVRPLVIEDSDAGVASGLAAGFEVLRIAHPKELAPRVRERMGLAGQDGRGGEASVSFHGRS